MIELRWYQRQILDELNHIPSIGLFMGTGTGKTYTSLFRVKENPTTNLLVVCPAKVVQQWQAVIPDVLPNMEVIEFKNNATARDINLSLPKINHGKTDYVIVVSLEIVSKLDNLLHIVNKNWTIILDESHKIKEYGTKRNPVKVTHAMLELSKKTDYKIILTATPTQKDKGGYIDYFTQLKFLGYMDLGLAEFQNKFCVIDKIHPIGHPFPVPIIRKYKNTEVLDGLLQLCCRRFTCQFGDFEPQHTKVTLPAPRSYRRLVKERAYDELNLTDLTSRRIAKKTLCTGVVLGRNSAGIQMMIGDNTVKFEWLQEFLINTDETVVIFYNYNVELETLETLCKNLGKKYITINGQTKDKFKAIQSEGYQVVLGQFAACGESVDGLQHRSHICIYFAMPESSLLHRQALGRIDRDGQTKVPMYYYLVMDKTIEDDIYKMTESKIFFNEETLNQLELKEDTE